MKNWVMVSVCIMIFSFTNGCGKEKTESVPVSDLGKTDVAASSAAAAPDEKVQILYFGSSG